MARARGVCERRGEIRNYFGGEKKPDLQCCNWIEVKAAEDRDGLDFVTDFVRTTDPTKPPTTVAGKTPGTIPLPPLPPGPASTDGGTGEKTEPPPCVDGTMRVVGTEEQKFTLLDGKQETKMEMTYDKVKMEIAAEKLSDYLKTIAELGGVAGDFLPMAAGPEARAGCSPEIPRARRGGDRCGARRKTKGIGVGAFTATMDVGLRDIFAACTTVEICVRSVWVTEKRFT